MHLCSCSFLLGVASPTTKLIKRTQKINNMYVILVYDVSEKRVVKMLKLCRRYLNWIQNSVFEGQITEVKLKELMHEAREIMDEAQDSIIIFSSRNERWLDKQIIGVEKNNLDNFL